ncbi:Disheveled-associated activator of morphogenesis 1 [Terramyces sp. JEL0728]|nr:Disheveled-associated activator of morphogenesis 1 [Terramyces sp. JEL0728]
MINTLERDQAAEPNHTRSPTENSASSNVPKEMPRGMVQDSAFLFGYTIKPSETELEIMLELMMEDVNLTEEKKVVIRKLSDERKWMMLVQNLSERFRNGPQEVLQEIQEIQKLKNGANRDLLNALEVSLRSRPIRWISEFIDHGGLGVMLDNLNELEETQNHNEFEELYIKCLKSFMNNKIGLSAVLDTDGALNVIALSLRSPSQRTRALVLEIFGAVCLLPGGHSSVLDAMDTLCEVAGTRFRFEIVIYALWQSCRGLSPTEKELQVASMSFINAVICGGPGAEFEFRMHVRWEFISLGLIQLIDKIGHIENELLQTQIDVWIAGMEADEAELFKRLDTNKINMDDSSELAVMLNQVMKKSSCEAPYISLLKHLTMLPANSFDRMKFILVIDKLVQQIIIQRNGEDPDPTSVLANIDMRHFMGELDNVESLKEQENRYQKQLEKSKRLEKEIETLKETSVNDKLAQANKRISELEKLVANSGPAVSSAPAPPTSMNAPPPPPNPMGLVSRLIVAQVLEDHLHRHRKLILTPFTGGPPPPYITLTLDHRKKLLIIVLEWEWEDHHHRI